MFISVTWFQSTAEVVIEEQGHAAFMKAWQKKISQRYLRFCLIMNDFDVIDI
jgi:hypothetical protein